MKKTLLASLAMTAALAFGTSAMAQTAADKPAGGEASAAGAPMGADGTPKSTSATKADRKMARDARKSKMKEANKSGEIPSPTVQPKSY